MKPMLKINLTKKNPLISSKQTSTISAADWTRQSCIAAYGIEVASDCATRFSGTIRQPPATATAAAANDDPIQS